jgi:hypothetical protein
MRNPNEYERRVMSTRCTPTDLILAEVQRGDGLFWFERNSTICFRTQSSFCGQSIEFKTAYSAMAAFEPTVEENKRAAAFFGESASETGTRIHEYVDLLLKTHGLQHQALLVNDEWFSERGVLARADLETVMTGMWHAPDTGNRRFVSFEGRDKYRGRGVLPRVVINEMGVFTRTDERGFNATQWLFNLKGKK